MITIFDLSQRVLAKYAELAHPGADIAALVDHYMATHNINAADIDSTTPTHERVAAVVEVVCSDRPNGRGLGLVGQMTVGVAS